MYVYVYSTPGRDTYGAGISPRYPPGGDRGSFGTPLARRTQGAQHRDTERARWSIETSTQKWPITSRSRLK
jgi:hypothetical protein